jgi:hypothetical protein
MTRTRLPSWRCATGLRVLAQDDQLEVLRMLVDRREVRPRDLAGKTRRRLAA